MGAGDNSTPLIVTSALNTGEKYTFCHQYSTDFLNLLLQDSEINKYMCLVFKCCCFYVTTDDFSSLAMSDT